MKRTRQSFELPQSRIRPAACCESVGRMGKNIVNGGHPIRMREPSRFESWRLAEIGILGAWLSLESSK